MDGAAVARLPVRQLHLFTEALEATPSDVCAACGHVALFADPEAFLSGPQ